MLREKQNSLLKALSWIENKFAFPFQDCVWMHTQGTIIVFLAKTVIMSFKEFLITLIHKSTISKNDAYISHNIGDFIQMNKDLFDNLEISR